MTEAVVATLDGEPLRAEFPLRTTVFGIPCVVVPEADYLASASAQVRRAPPPSHLDETDPEVAVFLREQFSAGVSIELAQDASRKRFGRKTTYHSCRSLWHKFKAEVGQASAMARDGT